MWLYQKTATGSAVDRNQLPALLPALLRLAMSARACRRERPTPSAAVRSSYPVGARMRGTLQWERWS